MAAACRTIISTIQLLLIIVHYARNEIISNKAENGIIDKLLRDINATPAGPIENQRVEYEASLNPKDPNFAHSRNFEARSIKLQHFEPSIFTRHTDSQVRQVLCVNGFIEVVSSCECSPGYTGEFCETSIAPYSGFGEGSGWKNLKNGQCVNGSPVHHNICVCHVGYTGFHCDALIGHTAADSLGSGNADEEMESLDGSGSRMNKQDDFLRTNINSMPWKRIELPEIRYDTYEEDYIHEDRFVVVATGIRNTSTKLDYTPDVKPPNGKGNVYRFSFAPEVENQKSRLELTTCFSKVEDIVSKYNGIPEELSVIAKTSCPIVHLPIGHIHSHEYQIFIPKEDFDINGRYILTQWHGNPDSTYLRDEMGCIAQIPAKDFHRLCSRGTCIQGSVFDHNTDFMGLRYNQGGYPPLTFWMGNGKFQIMARDDERIFIDKGGCPGKNKEGQICPEHPRQHVATLWSIPVEDFKFDDWVKFKWDIKWSEYSKASNNYKNPGTRTSLAWIRVWMDGKQIVDWTGPCGRNDGGRVPYFKAGIYNPSGSTVPIRFFFRRYQHRHWPPYEHSLEEKVKTLKLCSPEAKGINQNVLKSPKNFLFTSVSSGSENQCKLIAEVNNLSYLTNVKFSRMLVDGYTRQIITKLIRTLEVQDFKLRVLEKRLNEYDEADHDDEFDI